MNIDYYTKFILEAEKYFPGGVNSPVRSFKAVEIKPIFIKSGRGSKLNSFDGKTYIDYCLSWGALILGHSNPEIIKDVANQLKKGTSYGFTNINEIELAKRIIEAIPAIEKIRFVNSGTEATMAAVRLAQRYTGKKKFLKFDGCYHGSSDLLLNSENSYSAEYNNLNKAEKIIKQYYKEIACIIIEPIAGNMGVIKSENDFIYGLRKLCDKYKIILVFDEVINGFRVNYGSVQKVFGIKPDLICLGKIIGGGFPIGAFGGKNEIMKIVAPQGDLYQAGTFSGNPVTMVAGIRTLEKLKKINYELINNKAENLYSSIREEGKKNNIQIQINMIGSMFSLFFINEDVKNYSIAKKQDIKTFVKFYNLILNQGILFSPSPLESNFISFAHQDKDISKTIKVISNAFRRI